MDKFLEESLKSARDRHASAMHWSLILLSLLFLSHILFFSRFLHLRRDVQGADEQEKILSGMELAAGKLVKMQSDLDELLKKETSRITRTEIVDRTVHAFRALNARVVPLLDAERFHIAIPASPSFPNLPSLPAGTFPPLPLDGIPVGDSLPGNSVDLRTGGPLLPGPPGIGSLRPPSGPIPGDLSFSVPGSSIAVQMPPEAMARPFQQLPPGGGSSLTVPLDLPPFDPALEQSLRGAADVREVRELLRTYVRDHIVTPSFSGANLQLDQFTRNAVLPKLAENLRQIKDIQQQNAELESRMRPELAKQAPNFAQMIAALEKTTDHAKKVRLEPPADDDWWGSVEQKERTATVLAVNTLFEMRPMVGADLDRLDEMVHHVRNEQDRVRQQLDQQMKAVEQSYTQLQQTAKTLDGSLGTVFLDLESFVFGFPMILAVALSAALIATAYRMRAVRVIHRLVVQTEPQAETWKPALGLVGLDRASLRRSTFVIGLVGVAWVMVALVQLHAEIGWGARDVFTALLALALIGGATLARYFWLAESEPSPAK